MGGDKYVAHVAGDAVERQHGDALRDAWIEEFDLLIGEIRPFAATAALLTAVQQRGFRIVLASSGKSKHVETFLDLFGGKDIAEAWTTSDDAENSKPEPDIVQVALQRVRGARGIMIGDSTWDCVAAGKLDISTLAVRTGGFSADELRMARAAAVYESLDELMADLDNTPLSRRARRLTAQA